jgi:hypothetical protein
MNEALIICCALAVCFSIIALICGLVAIAMVAGFTRSTHTVQFKPLPAPGQTEDVPDPLAELLGEEEIGENPFRRKKKPEEKIDTESEQKEFMEEVTDSNNF